jgi:hypothetical protein
VLYFFPIDVFKTTPQACDFTVPVWSPSRAKVACGRQMVADKNLVYQEKETWLTHLFSAMGVPRDA